MPEIYRFRNCVLDTVERFVTVNGTQVPLRTKAFDVLQYLVENSGRVVTRDELIGHVWDGAFVEESNLPVYISKLRAALYETRTQRFIETVHGTGYRFVVRVTADDSQASLENA